MVKRPAAIIAFTILGMGCVTTRLPEPAYRRQFTLKLNAYLYQSSESLDNFSVFFKGPSVVYRLYWAGVTRPINVAAQGVPMGTKILIKRLLDTSDVGPQGEKIDTAEILIIDSNTIAYAQWPALKKIIE